MKRTVVKRSSNSTAILALLAGAIGSFGLGSAPLLGQERADIVTLVPSLQWQLTASRRTNTSTLETWKGDPSIEHEYGVTAFTARSYQFESHKADVLIEQTPDTSAAYGLFTFYRESGMTSVRGMALTVVAGNETLMVRGPAFIRLSVNRGSISERDYVALLKTIGGAPPSARALEQLPASLPVRGLVRESEKYLLGPLAASRVLPTFPPDLMGFQSGAEVQTAEYVLGRDKLTLVAINYPTPQIARSAFDSIAGKIGAGAAGKTDQFQFRRDDTYVLATVNATSPAVAGRFLDQFKVAKTFSRDQVTAEHSEAMQLVNLLFANAVIIIGLSGVSLIGGVLVFASKRLARKWFANSYFVDGEHGGFTILKLNWTK